ncbi:MAG: FAD-dependent oxidoreductase [Euryarchaeota archaeon]|nr:FAD-dependent oxidoreductase [Euryarchaeota archaeon]MDE1880024.1 FAD-dependent oxidoreductase [Euryarchaeota archaeon]MDE2046147.1 FAD-dependent oxidoreductase [Thermoplasmata archaeon]
MTEGGRGSDFDVLVIGGGIGGMESSLSLGDMGFHVLLVEKEPSVGGKMILLSKVFPTLDCASCISTPKMAGTQNHPNVRTLVYSEVERISRRPEGGFEVVVRRKPTYVDFAKCTGCSLCETACTVALPDEFNADLAARKAAHIAFPQAVPKKAVITRKGLSPCSHECPAGVKPHGYISLVRAGKYDEAFRQHLEDAPLVGVLSRACYAPCEEACTRAEVDGTVTIRGIKRFMADRYYAAHPEPEYGPPKERTGKQVAIVGSGPSGLTAAFYLGREGHSVTIFEAAPEPGGIMRWGIPAYRLPREVLARDVMNVTALGVEIRTSTAVRSLQELHGYDAVLLAVGSTGGRKLGAPGEEAPGVVDAVEFLGGVRAGRPMDLRGKKVVVIGGGNVAMDSSRSALRLGAAKVDLYCLESRLEMPAHRWEVQEAEEEGISIHPSWGVGKVETGAEGRATGLEMVRCSSVFDAQKRFNPTFDRTVSERVGAEVILLAIGLRPQTSPFAKELELNRGGSVKADPETLQTSDPRTFSAGDAVMGPANIVRSIGQGKRAAFYIDRFLRGTPLQGIQFDVRMPVADKAAVVAQASSRPPREVERAPVAERIRAFAPFERAMTEEEARYGATRCLDCGGCSECRECIAACPADAIDLHMATQMETYKVGAIALATGFDVFDAQKKPLLGFGKFPNVITGVQMDRILAPTRPYNAVLRPSDGKSPSNIGFVLCTGSRDEQVGNRACSRVCCMYSVKQATLLMGALPTADITIYYTDIRAFGKGYEEFFQQAQEMGVRFVRGKVARVEEVDHQDLEVHYEDFEGNGGVTKARHDLVVLAVGLLPHQLPDRLFQGERLERDSLNYVREMDEELDPGRTNIDGVFAVGAASAVRDIPDTVLHSGAASAQIAAYLKRRAEA